MQYRAYSLPVHKGACERAALERVLAHYEHTWGPPAEVLAHPGTAWDTRPEGLTDDERIAKGTVYVGPLPE